MSHDVPYAERAFGFEVACKIIGICPNTGLKYVRNGKLKSFRIGKRHLVTGRDIHAFQEEAKRKVRS